MNEPKFTTDELRKMGLVPLKEKDMFSIWIKTDCCNLNSGQLRKIADLTDKYARGFLLFTSRQIPIIPFVHFDHILEVKRQLEEAEIQLDHNGPIVRNLNICYDDKTCADAVLNCIPLGEKLERFFGSQLAHKIKIGVAGCPEDCPMSRVLTDISFIGVNRDNHPGYAAYAGGRLGVNPSIGIKVAEDLSEDECVNLAQNYFDLLAEQGRKGERAADVIMRLGAGEFTAGLRRDLNRNAGLPAVHRSSGQEKKPSKSVIKIRAVCGEVTSEQVRKIAGIAEKYGNSLVHFAVRGAPEIPGVAAGSVPEVRRELAAVNLELIEDEIENFQSCFGGYCSEGVADPQALLKRLEKHITTLNMQNLKISISGAGCPNSCGIAHLSDIGFHGVVLPEIVTARCTCCGLCAAACKRKTIVIQDKKAFIDYANCAYCGACRSVCTQKAIQEKEKGLAVLLGGSGGPDPRLGVKIAEFVSEDRAFEIADNWLKLIKKTGLDTGELIDRIGIDELKKIITGAGRNSAEFPVSSAEFREMGKNPS